MKLSSALQKEIAAAVHKAEQQTNGEIVVYMVEQSARYNWAYWKVLVIALLTGLLVDLSPKLLSLLPAIHGIEYIVMFAVILIFLTLARFVPLFFKFFISDEELNRAVGSRACQAFVSEEVFNTSERTGILIFISLFEQKAIVLGDSGINAKVKSNQWDHVLESIVNGMKTRDIAGGISRAVSDCGELLTKSGLIISSSDKNELSNELRYFHE